MPGKDDLNDILDAALDELDDDSDDSCVDSTSQEHSKTISQTRDRNKSAPKPMFGPPRPPNISEEENAVMDMMRQMENLFPSEDFGKEGNTHVNLTPGKKDKSQDKLNNKQNGDSRGGEMNDTVSQLLKELSKTEDFDESAFQNFGDEMTEEMQKDWEEKMKKAGGGSFTNEDEDAMGNVADGMMKQLLSKEFMYEPMKDITERFPKWLAENKEKLSPEEYEKYGKQYQYFQRILHLYDYDPDNTARLTELMNDLQEFGQPPADIVNELAPDLEFDADGIPKVGGAMPGMNEDCNIM
mmetsp:Transcript_26162/g.38725  ORF Transcript_26162/g.38725 Transcript_26162/m.38725 type:complete len:297 (-) Transcript_26162:1121-2011(-)